MGNALNKGKSKINQLLKIKEHEISPQPTASGGVKMMWKIFPATHKTTKQEVR